MQNSIIKKLRMLYLYSLIGLLLQAFLFNILFATDTVKGQNLDNIVINFEIQNASCFDAFTKIEEKTHFKFFYSNNEICDDKKLFIEDDDYTLRKLLEILAEKYKLSFKRINGQIVVKKNQQNFSSIQIVETKNKFKGKIIDIKNNRPLELANVYVIEKYLGTATDSIGYFELELDEDSVLVKISYLGYKQQITSIKKDEYKVILLEPISYSLNEINVYAKEVTEEISSVGIKSKKIRSFAGLTKDALRSLQLMPGVSSNNEASADINVRGGTYDENLVLINDVEVYRPYHLKEISQASVSIFNIDLVKNMNFSAGGYSAQYGNALSALTKVEYDYGRADRYSAKFDLSLIDLSAVVTGPLGNKGSFLGAVRHSYLDYVLDITDIEGDVSIKYSDIHLSGNYNFNSSINLKATFIYSTDDGIENPQEQINSWSNHVLINNKQSPQKIKTLYTDETIAKYSNLLGSLTLSSKITNSLASETILSYYSENEDEFGREYQSREYSFSEYEAIYGFNEYKRQVDNLLKINTFGIAQNLKLNSSKLLMLKGGIEYKSSDYDYDVEKFSYNIYEENYSRYPNITKEFFPGSAENNDTTHLSTKNYRVSAFIENISQLGEKIYLTYGIRGDYYDVNRETKISPRISLSYGASENLTLKFAWGYFYQPPSFKQLDIKNSIIASPSTQKAIHYIAGFDYKISPDISFRLEGFYKDYAKIIPSVLTSYGQIYYPIKKANANGYSVGFDTQFIIKINRANIWLSYGLLSAKERIDGESEYYSRYSDQTHTLSFTCDFDLGYDWGFSFRGFYGSGYRYTPYNAEKIEVNNGSTTRWVEGKKNSDTLPDYNRLDIRLDKIFNFGNNSLSIYLDVMNIFNVKNVIGYSYHYSTGGGLNKESRTLFGIVPTLGFSYQL